MLFTSSTKCVFVDIKVAAIYISGTFFSHFMCLCAQLLTHISSRISCLIKASIWGRRKLNNVLRPCWIPQYIHVLHPGAVNDLFQIQN